MLNGMDGVGMQLYGHAQMLQNVVSKKIDGVLDLKSLSRSRADVDRDLVERGRGSTSKIWGRTKLA